MLKVKHSFDLEEFFRVFEKSSFYPSWLREHLFPVLSHKFKKAGGEFIISYEGDTPTGGLYYNVHPSHLSYGKPTAIFGWVFVDDFRSLQVLMEEVERTCKREGIPTLRGPINIPKMYGGWGVPSGKEKGEFEYYLDGSRLDPRLNEWFLSLGYVHDTTYVAILDKQQIQPQMSFPDITFLSPPLSELRNNRSFLTLLLDFISQYFTSILPDVTMDPDKVEELLMIYSQYSFGNEFYMVGYEEGGGNDVDISRQRPVCIIIGVPNVMERWRGKEGRIHTTVVDTAIVDKKYWGKELFHVMYNKYFDTLKKRGLDRIIAGHVWKRNDKAIRSFLKIGRILEEYYVYKKELGERESEDREE